MKFIPNNVSRKVMRPVLISQKHSPTVLFAAGVIGVVTATVLACRATRKLDEVLDGVEKDIHQVKELDNSSRDRQKDLAYIYIRTGFDVIKLYGPAVIIGVTAIGCLGGSHRILTKRNAALTAAYAALDKGFKEYRQRVVDELGLEKDLEFRHGVVTKEIIEEGDKGHKIVEVKKPYGASIYARFFDEYSPLWSREPMYNGVFLTSQQRYANDMLLARGHLFLNEVYDMLGLDRSKAGAVVGWVVGSDGGDGYVDFGIYSEKNPRARDFVMGYEQSILLDFNVDGVIYDKI